MNTSVDGTHPLAAEQPAHRPGKFAIAQLLLLAAYLVAASVTSGFGAYRAWPNGEGMQKALTQLAVEAELEAQKRSADRHAAASATPKPASPQAPVAGEATTSTQPADSTTSSISDARTTATNAPAAGAAKDDSCAITGCTSLKESNLVRFVFFMGVLGACIHAMTSMASFAGNQSFKQSWFIWYLLRPLIGGLLAWIVFLVFRGGFLGTTEVTQLNPYAFGALAALTGLFSKRVIDKLSELVDTLFRMPPGNGDDNRGDKLKTRKPLIKEVTPKEVLLTAAPVETVVAGENFTDQTVIKVGEHLLTPIFVTAMLLRLVIPPEHLKGKKTVPVTALNGRDAASISNEFLLAVKE